MATNRIFTSTPINRGSNVKADEFFHQRPLRKSLVYKCNYCPEKFQVQRQFLVHEKLHELNRHKRLDIIEPYLCNVCGRRFEEKTEIDHHRNVHLVKNVQNCRYENCKKIYAYDELRVRHEWIHEWIESLVECQPFECNKSELIFKSIEDSDEQPMDLVSKCDGLHIDEDVKVNLEKSNNDEQVGNSADELKNNFTQSTDNIITISISSDTESQNDDETSKKIPILRKRTRSPIESCTQIKFYSLRSKKYCLQQVNDCVQVETFKCNYCDLIFEENYVNLVHQCKHHQPHVVLTKVIVKETGNDVTETINNNPTEINEPIAKTNRRRLTYFTRARARRKVAREEMARELNYWKKNRKNERKELEIDEETIVIEQRMTRQRYRKQQIDLSNTNDDRQTKSNCNSIEIDNTANDVMKSSEKSSKSKRNMESLLRNVQPKYDCFVCKQRFTTAESLKRHRSTHSTKANGNINTTPISVGQCNQSNNGNELNVSNQSKKSIGISNGMTMESSQQNAAEEKCENCDLIFKQSENKLSHQCIAQTHQPSKISDDTILNDILDIINNDLTNDVRPRTAKRKRTNDNSEDSENCSSSKRSPTAHNQMSNDHHISTQGCCKRNSNNFMSIANDVRLQFNGFSNQKPIEEKQSKENVQNQQQQVVSSSAANFWKKSFLGIRRRQLENSPFQSTTKRLSTDLILKGVVSITIGEND